MTQAEIQKKLAAIEARSALLSGLAKVTTWDSLLKFMDDEIAKLKSDTATLNQQMNLPTKS